MPSGSATLVVGGATAQRDFGSRRAQGTAGVRDPCAAQGLRAWESVCGAECGGRGLGVQRRRSRPSARGTRGESYRPALVPEEGKAATRRPAWRVFAKCP